MICKYNKDYTVISRIQKENQVVQLQFFCLKNQSFTVCIKDTQRENTFSNKSQALTESTNMDIWVIGILNQLL